MPKPSSPVPRAWRAAPLAPGARCRVVRDRHAAAAASSSERSLRLLQCVAAAERAISLAELAERLELPKPTLHRLCTQLVAQGFLARDLDEKSYSAGAALRALAFDTLNRGTTRGLRHDVLTRLVEDVGETCNFTTLDGAQIVYLDRVEARWPLRLTLDVGSHVPLHCTSSGKLFLAHAARGAARGAARPGSSCRADAPTRSPRPRRCATECAAIARAGYSTRPRGVHRRADRGRGAGARRRRADPRRGRDACADGAPVARAGETQLPRLKAAARE